MIFAARPSECRFFCGNVTESQPEPGTRQMDETEAFPDPLIPGGKARIRQIPSAVPFCRADTGRVWRDFLKKKPLPLKGRFFGCSDSMAAKNLFWRHRVPRRFRRDPVLLRAETPMPFINETIRATSPKLLNFYQCNKIVKGKAKKCDKISFRANYSPVWRREFLSPARVFVFLKVDSPRRGGVETF